MRAGDRMTIAIAGGTGLLGRAVADDLCKSGRAQVRVISRHASPEQDRTSCQADFSSGEGLDAALAGVNAVIWCAHDREALANDAAWMRNLLRVCGKAKVTHLIYTGIAGIETARASDYYAGKLREEEVIAASRVPHTILRAAQFHTLALSLLEACDDGKTIHAPASLMLRPIAHEAVAERLAALALAQPRGKVNDLVGPQDCFMPALARQWVDICGLDRKVAEAAHAPARWALLQNITHGPAERAGPTFAQWLRARVRAS
jgi:uncharacterized protein YbjT (DUF2867 family)